MLQILVALSGSLVPTDYRKMGKVLWEAGLEYEDIAVVAPVSHCQCTCILDTHEDEKTCFLIMQCAEKTEHEFQKLVRDTLQRSVNLSHS